MAAQPKLYNIIFNEAPHQGKNTVLVAEVDPDAHPGHPLPEPPTGEPPVVANPICLPGMPCWGQDLTPGHPICLPGMPCWEPPGPEEPPQQPVVIPATVSSLPVGVTPPAAPSPDATVAIINFGPDAKSLGARSAYCWINPMINPLPEKK